MRKDDRQLLIKQLVLEYDIETQDELLRLLKEQGVHATQATISRDIKEMNLVKVVNDQDKSVYKIYQPNESTRKRLDETVKNTVIEVNRVEFLVILKTYPGSADVIAAVIDELNYNQIAATLAGHDTLVVICNSAEEASYSYDYFTEVLNK